MPSAPKHTRRWLQFSVGALLLVVTIVAIIAGSVAWAERNGFLPFEVFVHDTYLIINWQLIVLLLSVAVLLLSAAIVSVILITRLLGRRMRTRRPIDGSDTINHS